MDGLNTNTSSKRSASKQVPLASFKTANGVTVSLGPDEVLDYAGVRSEQLRDITQLLTNVATGGIELSPEAVQNFQLLANEFARDVNELIGLAAQLDMGGAQ